MNATKRTPLSGKSAEEKANIIEHVNEDHLTEVMYVVKAFTPYKNPHQAIVTDMFAEGVLLSITPEKNASAEDVFVKYTMKGEAHEQIRYLVFDATRKLKVKTDAEKVRYFWVRDKQLFTKHMLRLTLECNEDLPPPQAAFACSFAMKKLKRMPNTEGFMARVNKSIMLLFFLVLKRLPQKWRKSVMSSKKNQYRAYTYRRILTESNCIHVDIYLHGDTPANVWAKDLNEGDVVVSVGERDEDFSHLHEGKALLCADETALPAVAGLLSFWQNPEPPLVLLEVGDDAEFSYFDDIDNLPEHTEIRWLRRTDTHGEAILSELERIALNIDTAWGALENNAARSIRNHVRKTFNIPTKRAKITPYWRKA